MTSGLLLSTDTLPARETAPAWNSWMSGLFSGLESDLYGDTEFEGHLRLAYAGSVVMTRLQAARHRVVRSRHRLRSHESDCLKIVAPWQGVADVRQHGREASARNGSWVIYDTSQAYEVANPLWSEHLIVMLPKKSIAERGLALDGLMGRNVGGSSGIARIALETMRSTYQELPGMGPELAQRAGELLVDMVFLSLQELAGRGSAQTQQLAFKDRIRAHVAAHLRDPGLSADSMAVALGCSKRHLYNVFADEALSLAAYIQQCRLQLCMRELQQPTGPVRSITEVAYDCGFANSAHFSRLFKAYAGMAPSAWRALHAPAAVAGY